MDWLSHRLRGLLMAVKDLSRRLERLKPFLQQEHDRALLSDLGREQRTASGVHATKCGSVVQKVGA